MTGFTYDLVIAIGINQYQNTIAELKTAKHDAKKVADILRDEYQYQVELITDDTERKPTLEELKNLLKELPEKLQPPAENNRLLFYFAGHGMSLESNDGPRGFLLPQNADPKKPETFLSMQVLHDALIALPCHHLLVILDCCFAGTFRWASTREMILIPEAIHQEHYDRFIRYPAWQVITSAAHNQEALDFLSDKRGISKKSQDQEKKHSPFAEALFEALQNGDPDEKGRRYKKADLTKDGVITAPELYLYLRDNVETRSSQRQTPGLYPLKNHDRGEYIFHDPNFDPETLSKADPIDETNNPYRGLKPFEEEHARFFFGRQELIENLYVRIAAPDHSLTVVLGVSGSGKSSLVRAGLIPYLRELSEPEVFALNLVKVCILTSAILDVFAKFLFLPQLLPINDLHQWHILNPIRPGESPFAALARTIWAIADIPATVQLDSLGFLREKLNQKTEQLNTKVDEASWEHGETSRITQRLKQEAEKFAQITTTWNQDTHVAKQLLIVEYFETLYALCQTEGEPESQQQRQLKEVFLACLNPLTEQLQSAPNSLVEIVKAWSQKHPGVKLLLVIDQFEELITLTCKAQPNPQSDTPEEWQQFLQLLETTLAATLPQLRIIVTLRSDFEPRFLNSEALKSYWTRARFPVRAMRSDELRQAIEGPASEMALYFEPDNLVDRLIDEVGQMPGALPLLSFTLSEFYIKLVQKWRVGESSDRALTIDAEFDKEGGVAGSLTRRANEEYEKLGEKLGEVAQRTMRRVMLRMLTLEGGQSARRRVPESELVYPTQEENDRVKQVVDRLVEARLLVKGQLETGEPYVEPAHDFLVRGWGTLQNWIDEEKAHETLELQQRLTAQANDWDRNNRPDGLLLPDGDRLNQLEKMFRQGDNWLNQRETEFIQNSIKYRDIQQKQVRKLRSKAELRGEAERIETSLLAQPLEGLVQAIQIMGRNLEELPEEALSAVENSLYKAMETVRVSNTFQGVDHKDVTSVAFSSDGQIIIICSDSTVRLWSLEGNPITQPFQGAKGAIGSVAFDSNGQIKIAAGGSENTVQLLDLQRNFISQPFKGHEGSITCTTFSPDGQLIASGSADNTIRLWNLQGNSISQPFKGHEGSITCITFSPDGQLIASGSADNTIRLWDVQGNLLATPFQGHESYTIPVPPFRPYEDYITSVTFSPDGQLIASCSEDRTIRLWDLQGKLLGNPFRGHEGSILSIAFSPDGQQIISGSRDKTIRLWDLQGNQISQSFQGHAEDITSVAYSSDGRKIISGSLFNKMRPILDKSGGSRDNTVYLWDLQDNSIGQPFRGHEEYVTSVAFSPNGQMVVSSGADNTVRLWNLQGDALAMPFQGHKEYVTSVAFSPNGQIVVSGGADSTVRLWDLQGNSIGHPLQGHEGNITFVSFSHDGQIIISGDDRKTVRLWDFQGRPIKQYSYEHAVTAAALSPNGSRIASCYQGDDSLILLELEDSSTILKFQKHEGNFWSVALSPDGQMVVGGSDDGNLWLYDLQSNLVNLPFQGHESIVTSVAFSPDGQRVVSGSWDRTIRLWDLQGNPIGSPFKGHENYVTCVAFSPNSQMIASGSVDKTIRLWNGNGRAWLRVCCDRLRYHPVFKNPQTEIERQACETCRKYVWSKEDTSV